ncbi:hypothetical protein ACFQZJ_19145 [Maribacter chungangensis]|uniref:DUF4468 domain-containing protein n=1 Tax=Maribacter chungangensis TaxID=1069117 RepID=A0ABW3B933_9FLAO
MRTLRFLTLVGLLQTGCFVQSQSTTEIKSIYYRIQKELPQYRSKTAPVFGMSTEGGETKGYYKNGTIQKISTVLLGETGKWFQEAYYNNGELVFVLETDHRYNAPIYFDQKAADEMGVTDVFDIEKTTITENRYYFKNKVLFKWLNPTGNPEDASLESLKKKTEGLLYDSKKLQGILDNYNEEKK